MLLLCCSPALSGCPHAARMLRAAGDESAMPKDHSALVASAAATNMTVGLVLDSPPASAFYCSTTCSKYLPRRKQWHGQLAPQGAGSNGFKLSPPLSLPTACRFRNVLLAVCVRHVHAVPTQSLLSATVRQCSVMTTSSTLALAGWPCPAPCCYDCCSIQVQVQGLHLSAKHTSRRSSAWSLAWRAWWLTASSASRAWWMDCLCLNCCRCCCC
jgi:hypothetical protein